MTLKDMRISTQLRLGLGLILALVILLGAEAWIQSNQLWSQTESIYKHPLQVTRAIGLLNAGIQNIRLEMRDLLLAKNEKEITSTLQNIETNKADVSRHFDIIYNRYLGSRDNITSLENDFVAWNVIQDEIIKMYSSGKNSKALARMRISNEAGGATETLMQHILEIQDFARNKGDDFYQTAKARNDELNHQLIIIVTIILLLSLLVSWQLLKGIKEPLISLTKAAEQFRLGAFSSRSEYISANEFGALSATFNEMAETVETQMSIKQQAARLAGVMLREVEARSFCRELVKELIEQTESQSGAIYLLNTEETLFEHFESIGMTGAGRSSFVAETHEGEFGKALVTGMMERITDIPDDTRFIFSAVGGDYIPREIMTIPLVDKNKVIAMISLASIHSYDEKAIRLLEAIISTVTARMNGVLTFRKVQELAEQLDRQNQELNAQKNELSAQATELTHQNDELEMQKKQLDAANRLKSTFLSNMSHELRTPLNSVIALSSVLGRRLAKKIPEEEFDYLEVIERNGKHLLALINDILDLSRIESGRIEISPARFSLRELMAEMLAMIEPQAKERNIILENHIDETLPPITTDPEKFRHIVQNLISNAVKFTDTGSVEVSAQCVNNEINIFVRDTGIGIAAKHLSHIFEEFRQADEGTSRRYGGTGLGLAIAKKYATLLQGDITVDSTPGEGSTFTIRLPLTLSLPGKRIDTYRHRDTKQAINQQEITTGQGQCILLVEDSEPAVIQITDILTEQGYRVEVARDGSDALAYVEGCLPDAVVLDLMMPGIDGFEVLKQIRSTDRTAPLPVLILTAKHVTKEELSFLTGNNIHQLIQKGDVGKSELLATVARMVAKPQEKSFPAAQIKRPHRVPPLVLIVEDNPDNLKTAIALLDDQYQVVTATDGLAAIEQARQHLPDLILMDLALPVIDGFAALTEIRKDEALLHIPVVVVTASAMKGDRDKILAHGFDGYISKPIEEEMLTRTLKEVFHGNE